MHTKSTTPHRTQHQIGHARPEHDAEPGQATADLAPIAWVLMEIAALIIAVTVPIVIAYQVAVTTGAGWAVALCVMVSGGVWKLARR